MENYIYLCLWVAFLSLIFALGALVADRIDARRQAKRLYGKTYELPECFRKQAD